MHLPNVGATTIPCKGKGIYIPKKYMSNLEHFALTQISITRPQISDALFYRIASSLQMELTVKAEVAAEPLQHQKLILATATAK